MAQNFKERLKKSPVLCDGAMGTLLYSKGIFINRCYDELNLSQPELIRGVHHEYLQAGAEIIETNTFGGNSFRLARHSLADRVRDINLAGARVAREAAKSFDVWVAGSVGPLGVRIEPLGKTSFAEARTAFRDQIAALVEGGVDLLMLETFGYVEELHQAVLACRDVNPNLPIVAQVTIDEDGNCLDGSDPESFAARLTEWNVDVIGINCSVGPGRHAGCDRARARFDHCFPLPPSPTPAFRVRWKDATSISARRNTWRATRENLWRPEFAWSADVAEPLPTISGP